MDSSRVHTFAKRYFAANGCHIIESSPSYLQVQLSVKVDKELINRPFYWMYVEKMNLKPNPVTLTLVSNPEQAPEGLRGELLSFGTPRFTQILQSAIAQGRFIRLYEEERSLGTKSPSSSTPYFPWLAINFKVSYICDQKKDALLYLGLNLYDGSLLDPFYPQIKLRSWTPKLPAHRHIVQPKISVAEGVGKLEYYLQEYLEQQDLSWAAEARERLQQELSQLDQYYPDLNSLTEEQRTEKKQRIQEAFWQYHPRIEVEVINAGLFYSGNIQK